MDDVIRKVLTEARVIAVVGWSPKADRPSHRVAGFLAQRYRVIPVNPGVAGQVTEWGEVVRGSLAEIEAPVDMVDIFRNSEDAGGVVDEVMGGMPGKPAIWMQLGVVNEAAAERARAAGHVVVMDRCPAIEIPRLGISL